MRRKFFKLYPKRVRCYLVQGCHLRNFGFFHNLLIKLLPHILFWVLFQNYFKINCFTEHFIRLGDDPTSFANYSKLLAHIFPKAPTKFKIKYLIILWLINLQDLQSETRIVVDSQRERSHEMSNRHIRFGSCCCLLWPSTTTWRCCFVTTCIIIKSIS